MKSLRFHLSLAVAVLVLIGTGVAQAAVLVSEDFDSYTTTADMQAVWGAAGAGSLDTVLSYSSPNSAYHPGGTVNNRTDFGTVDASATENLVLSAKIYDDAEVANDRITVGLRGGPFPLFEMGRYNSDAAHPYYIRATLFNNGINPSWVNFPNATTTQGWHSYEATFSLSGLTVTLDLMSDGTIDDTIFLAGDGNPYGGFSDLRFGGPSNSSSAGGGANFDDIVLETVPVPEPTTVLLAGLAGLGLALVRRR